MKVNSYRTGTAGTVDAVDAVDAVAVDDAS
jgi:hypothetical protein